MPITSDLLIVVPARGGSKRLPGKNLAQIDGRTLIAWTAQTIADGARGARAVLSTDDPEIAAEGRRVGLATPFLRPAELAGDEASTVDVVLHALDHERAERGRDPEFVCVLQPTSPLRGSACLRAALALISHRADVGSVVAMTPSRLSAEHHYLHNARGFVRPIDAQPGHIYVPNGALYLSRTVLIRELRTLYAAPILPLLLPPQRGVDIDTQADLEIARVLVALGLPQEPADAAGFTLADSPRPEPQ